MEGKPTGAEEVMELRDGDQSHHNCDSHIGENDYELGAKTVNKAGE